jgi:hypothetical protein
MHAAISFRTFTLPFLLFLLLFPCPEAFAQDKKLCPKCKSTGKIPNPFLTEAIIALEENVEYCSHVFDADKTGRGLPWFPCERCRNPSLEKKAREEFDQLVADREAWIQSRRDAVDRVVEPRRELLHLQTKHFTIAWNIPRITTADKKKYKMHEALHLYAQRMEDFYADFLRTLDIKDEEMRNRRHFLYLFEDQKSCLKAAKEFTGLNCWNAAKLPGNPSILVSWKDITYLKTDEDFHRHLIHHVSHLLNIAYFRMEWMALTAGWADEGLAHYFEMKYFNKADNTCDEEGEEEELSNSDWEVEVRKLVEEEKAVSFAEISVKTTTGLHGDDHKLSWSYVDFLMKKNPRKFKLFMQAIKLKKPAMEALKESYGLNFITFQSQWKAYVLEKYRKKPLKVKGRRNRR